MVGAKNGTGPVKYYIPYIKADIKDVLAQKVMIEHVLGALS